MAGFTFKSDRRFACVTQCVLVRDKKNASGSYHRLEQDCPVRKCHSEREQRTTLVHASWGGVGGTPLVLALVIGRLTTHPFREAESGVGGGGVSEYNELLWLVSAGGGGVSFISRGCPTASYIC